MEQIDDECIKISKAILTADIKLSEKLRKTEKDKRSSYIIMPKKENILRDEEEYYELDNDRKKYVLQLGKGVTGHTFLTQLKDEGVWQAEEGLELVLKKSKRNRYSENEMLALAILRDKMDKKEIPPYYIYCYTQFKDQNYQYLLLERADIPLDDYLTDKKLNTKEYLELFYQIADAIEYLEAIKFNHGDLWNDNLMVVFNENGYAIKLIDYDAAFMANSDVRYPNLGGGDNYRRKFLLGYDLNRYFDAVLHSYNDFITKKRKNKLAKAKKSGKKVARLEEVDKFEDDESDLEFDEENVVFTPEILTFIKSLECVDPNEFSECEETSGKSVKEKIMKYASSLDLKLDLPV